MHSFRAILELACLAAVAGYSQGLTGFGFALVFTPLASLLYPARDVVLAAAMIGGLLGLLIVLETWRSLPWRRARPMLLSAIVGAPLGVALLAFLEVNTFRVLLSVIALASAVAFLVWRPGPLRREGFALAAVGILGGFLNGCTSMGAPPAALLVANQRWGVAESRSSLALFNLLSLAVSLGVASKLGVLHEGSWLTASISVPAAVGGTVAGAFSARKLSANVFRKVLVGIVAIAATMTLLFDLFLK